MNWLKKTSVLCLYTAALGLAGHGWLSEILPVSTKLVLTGIAVLMIASAFALQWKWRITE